MTIKAMTKYKKHVKALVNYIILHKKIFIGLGIFLLALVIRIGYFYILGIQAAGDTNFYLGHSESIIAANGNPLVLLEEGVPFYYWVYPIFLALFNNNLQLVILAHIVLHAAAAFFVYKIGERIFNQATGIIAGVGYAFLWEIMHWNLYILTDSLFVFMLVAAVYAFLKAIDTKTYLRWGIFAATILLILFLRPTALPFVAAFAVVLTYNWSKYYKLAGITIAAIAVLYLMREVLLSDPGARLGVGGYIHYFISLYEQGVIIRDRPAFILPIVWDSGFTFSNLINFLYMFSYRLIAFWLVYVSSFTFGHILINLATLIPLYIFGLVGAYKGLVKEKSRYFVVLLLCIIVFFWIFQALTEVDYDFRYRLPVLPFLLLLAAYGFSSVANTLVKKFTGYQIARYGVVGIANLLVDIAVLNVSLLVLGFNLFWSTFLGFLAGGMLGYFLHSRWTFEYDTSGKNLIKFSHFIFIAIVGLTLTEIIMHYLTSIHVNYNYAKLVALVVSVSWAYSATKWWVFRKKSYINNNLSRS